MDEFLWIVVVVEGFVDEVSVDDIEGLLLKDVFFVLYVDVYDDVVGWFVGFGLEMDVYLVVIFVGVFEILCRDCVGEDEEGGFIVVLGGEMFVE